jgi:serine/threonine protein kinase
MSEPTASTSPKDDFSPDNLPRGASIGRYLVVDRLGAGGMGVVYAAYDPDLNRKVAIKLLRSNQGGQRDSERRVRLLREAHAMARLSHPNVIAVYDVGTAFDQVFVAMEFVDGGTLTDWLKREKHSTDALLEMFYYAGCGLAAAHAADLIHRDFKPDAVTPVGERSSILPN